MKKVGRWCALIVGPSGGWDRTIVGLAVYDGDGRLVFFKWTGMDKAILRGDWQRDWTEYTPDVPETWAEMEKRINRLGNLMSNVRWEAGYPTLTWEPKFCEDFYNKVVMNEPS
jgi:hypothetical protein